MDKKTKNLFLQKDGTTDKSPLQMLAQTCSQIGADSGPKMTGRQSLSSSQASSSSSQSSTYVIFLVIIYSVLSFSLQTSRSRSPAGTWRAQSLLRPSHPRRQRSSSATAGPLWPTRPNRCLSSPTRLPKKPRGLQRGSSRGSQVWTRVMDRQGRHWVPRPRPCLVEHQETAREWTGRGETRAVQGRLHPAARQHRRWAAAWRSSLATQKTCLWAPIDLLCQVPSTLTTRRSGFPASAVPCLASLRLAPWLAVCAATRTARTRTAPRRCTTPTWRGWAPRAEVCRPATWSWWRRTRWPPLVSGALALLLPPSPRASRPQRPSGQAARTSATGWTAATTAASGTPPPRSS